MELPLFAKVIILIIAAVGFAIEEAFVVQSDSRTPCPNEVEPDPVVNATFTKGIALLSNR
jgi:hypothetical protein